MRNTTKWHNEISVKDNTITDNSIFYWLWDSLIHSADLPSIVSLLSKIYIYRWKLTVNQYDYLMKMTKCKEYIFENSIQIKGVKI